MLDVHGEPRSTWPANDALCAALQINNHLQDCHEDFCNLDRVYVPLDALAAAGARVEELGATRSSPALLRCLQGLARRTAALLAESEGFSPSIRDFRLSLEVAVITAMARRIVGLLIARDPLSENVRLGQVRHDAGGARRRRRRFACPHAPWRRAGRRVEARMSAAVAETASPNAGRASGSSFYAAMRILPKPQREAMFAIYGFCRQVDDIADSPGPRDERRAALAEWRGDIEALYQGRPTPLTSDLLQPMRDFGLEKADFLAVIDGMEMDVLGDIRAPSWSELDLYCDRVASAVGRLSVRIFGMDVKPGRDLAHHLGRALQLTNILRDLDEDAAVGRLYLPREALSRPGSRPPIRKPRSQARARPRLPRARRRRARAFRSRPHDHGRRVATGGARAAHHGRGLPPHPRARRRTRLCAAAPAGPPRARRASPSSSCAMHFI